MNLVTLTMNSLFQQLGMAHSNSAISEFFKLHYPLPPDIPLPEAGIWNASQAEFLRQAISEDSEWSMLADQLDTSLREIPPLDEHPDPDNG